MNLYHQRSGKNTFQFSFRRFLSLSFLFGMFLLNSGVSSAIDGSPSNYRQLLKNLKAGESLVLQPGIYLEGLPLHGIVGESGKPITITGVKGAQRPAFVARSGHNTISIVDSAYVHLKDLELDGRGLPVDGVKAEGHSKWTHHIVLENLLIRGRLSVFDTRCS